MCLTQDKRLYISIVVCWHLKCPYYAKLKIYTALQRDSVQAHLGNFNNLFYKPPEKQHNMGRLKEVYVACFMNKMLILTSW